jgi:hypothetical protein
MLRRSWGDRRSWGGAVTASGGEQRNGPTRRYLDLVELILESVMEVFEVVACVVEDPCRVE